MGVLPDWMLKRDVKVEPMEDAIRREGKISWGVGSYGIDMRIGYVFRVFSPINATEIDPKNFDERSLVTVDCTGKDYILIPPHSFALGESVETFEIPRDTLCIVIGKSTYARCGIVVNCTPLEPEWKGKVTIEISNTTPLPARIYCGEGIAQCVFIRTNGYTEALSKSMTEILSRSCLSRPDIDAEFHKMIQEASCRVSYADKKGKYDKQTGITLPKVD